MAKRPLIQTSFCRKANKTRYWDEVAAKLDLSRIQNNGGGNLLPTRAYRCPMCKGWHLTSQEKKNDGVDAK